MKPRTDHTRRAWEFLQERGEATTNMVAAAGALHNMRAFRLAEKHRRRMQDRRPGTELRPRSPESTEMAITYGRRSWALRTLHQWKKAGHVDREERNGTTWWIVKNPDDG